jgi:hypothetical protein
MVNRGIQAANVVTDSAITRALILTRFYTSRLLNFMGCFSGRYFCRLCEFFLEIFMSDTPHTSHKLSTFTNRWLGDLLPGSLNEKRGNCPQKCGESRISRLDTLQGTDCTHYWHGLFTLVFLRYYKTCSLSLSSLTDLLQSWTVYLRSIC